MQSLVVTLWALDPIPTDNNVKAGWVAFAVFVLLILAVAVLCRSFLKQMRRVEEADAAGVYGEKPDSEPTEGADQLPSTHTRADG
jgi:hypothetical protein